MYNSEAMDIKTLTKEMNRFVTEKGWYAPGSPRPQTPRNLAISINLEAAEILELFQWADKSPDPSLLASECADVALYLLQLASISNIDLEQAIMEKLRVNRMRQWDQDIQTNEESNL